MVTFDAGLISGLLLSSNQGRFLKVDDKSCHLMTKEHAHFMYVNLECSLLVSCARFAINVS